jgi:hypothetical protein
MNRNARPARHSEQVAAADSANGAAPRAGTTFSSLGSFDAISSME